MQTAFAVLGTAHWAGLALIVIGYIMSLAQGVIHGVMVWGARVQLLLGLALVAVAEMAGSGVGHSHMWVGIKLVIALLVVALCEIARAKARKGSGDPALMHIAAALTAINVAYALFG